MGGRRRMRRRREEYKGGGLHRSKGLPRAVRRGRGERARSEGDLKLKLPRFRLDEFISLAGKIRSRHPPNSWKSLSLDKMEILRFRDQVRIFFIHQSRFLNTECIQRSVQFMEFAVFHFFLGPDSIKNCYFEFQ